jgi:hypothetical protein
MLGQPIFPGESGVDQLVEIIKILGTPSREQILAMNPDYKEYRSNPYPGKRCSDQELLKKLLTSCQDS